MIDRTVYRVVGSEGYELCHPVDVGDFECISSRIADESPVRDHWMSVRMELVRSDEGKSLRRSDAPWFGSQALIFRREVVDALGGYLLTYGELLPLQCDDADVVMFNSLRRLDALNEQASAIMRHRDGRIMLVTKPVFKASVIEGVDVFKLRQMPAGPTLVSSRFVDLWHEHGFEGLDFVVGGAL